MQETKATNFFNYFKQFSKIEDKGLTFISRDFGKHKISYHKLYDETLNTAASLRKAGVKEGDIVALILPNGPEFVRLFLGLLVIGAIPTALYPPLILAKIEDYLQTLEEQLKILNPKALITFKAIKGPLGNVVTKFNVALWDASDFEFSGESKEWVIPKQKTAFIQFSSGTTGAAKPALISHEHLANNVESIIAGLQLKEGIDSGVSWLPLYHDMGLVGGFFTALATKSDMAILRPEEFLAKPALWLKTIHEERATITVAPNFAYGFAAQKISEKEMQDWDLSCVRVALCGAEQVSYETMNLFTQKFGARGFRDKALLPVYGMSEATLALAFPSVFSGAKFQSFNLKSLAQGHVEVFEGSDSVKLASVGKAVKNVVIEIRDDENKLAREGESGNIWAKGNAIIDEYLSGPLIKDRGFFFTGDRGFIYEENLYIAGRSKDVLIVRGKNIDATFAESVLYEFKEFRTGRWAIKADIHENIYVLAEIRKPLGVDEVKKLVDGVKVRMAHKIGIHPTHIVFLAPGSLPRTTSGKIRRQNSLDLYLQKKLKAPNMNGFFVWPKFIFYTLKGHLSLWIFAMLGHLQKKNKAL